MSAPEVAVTVVGDGPRVLLVHGGNPRGGAAAFAAQHPLADRWRLVMPDRPGHGRTPASGRSDFDRDADLLTPLLGADGAHVVGHSYGAVVALQIAVSAPQRVRSLALIEPPAYCFAAADPSVAQMAAENQRLFEQPPSNPEELLRGFFTLTGIPLPPRLPNPLPPPLLQAATSLAHMRGPYEANFDAADLVVGGYPVLVITSGQMTGFEAIAEAIAAQTGGTHVVVPGTTHSVQDAGEPVNEILEQLWSQR